jgi:WASH complex subunit 7
MTVAQSISQLIQHHSLLCIDIVGKAKQRLVAEKRYSDKRLDVLGALTLMQTCLNGPGTKQRLLVSKLALGVAMGMQKLFQDDELLLLGNTMKKVEAAAELIPRLQWACDCSFLYWHRAVIEKYFIDVYENPSDANRLHVIRMRLFFCGLP